jgi:endonuclease/exonuclease/phosphatase family metal-dependent hydrolase
MMRSPRIDRLCAFAVAASGCLLIAASALASNPIMVMSFNIRYGTAEDGENHWTRRRGVLFDVLRQQNADLIGLQEALDSQIREITAAVPVYVTVGVGRDDARTAGEYSAILVRNDRFTIAEAGTFWFSDTPAIPGSTSWGNRITRICTWARLIDADGAALWIFNVHLDHESQPSRERSTGLLAKRIESRAFPNEPVIVTGDFNAGEANRAIAELVPKRFVDSFRVAHPNAREVGTFNGFEFGTARGPKIDYVLVPPGTEVFSAEIVRTSQKGRYPSDHFPVVARIRLSAPKR